jgi:hypothetical protein
MSATSTEARRELRFNTIHDVMRDVESLATGKIRACRHGTPAQVVQHLADWIHGSIDGFAGRDPDDLPNESTTWIGALCDLRLARERIRDERMTAAHPERGGFSEVDWIRFHCRYAERLLSQLKPA